MSLNKINLSDYHKKFYFLKIYDLNFFKKNKKNFSPFYFLMSFIFYKNKVYIYTFLKYLN